MSKCDNCGIGKFCTGSFYVSCVSNGYEHYEPKGCGDMVETKEKQANSPITYIQIVVTDEARRLSGNPSNVYMFDGNEFTVATAKCCGKEFVQVRKAKTGESVLMLDVSVVLVIDREYQPVVAYCV